MRGVRAVHAPFLQHWHNGMKEMGREWSWEGRDDQILSWRRERKGRWGQSNPSNAKIDELATM